MMKPMRHKKAIIIICSLLFFLTALTFYINRVIFPQWVKKIAVERIESLLKRKTEIGSIHFNWVRGFIIDKIKIYEKDSSQIVFAQADQVSFGILFFPGPKQYKISIPFINVRSPSVHLIRTGKDTWNFSDMLVPAPATPAPVNPVKEEKKPSFELSWGGITIADGKFLVDDASTAHPWSEYFDQINLKLSLSYKGINYNFTANIPRKNGLVSAIVYYQPITQNTQAQIHLRNIDTASYLSLINIPDMHLDHGIIKEINLNINYSQNQTSAQGDVIINNLDVSRDDQIFKGDIEIHNLDALYQNGDISARGQMAFSHIESHVPGLSLGGSVQTRVNDFKLTKEGVTFLGSLQAQDIFVNLKDRMVQAHQVALDNIRVRQSKEGIHSVGNITTKGLIVQWPHQRIEGDIALKAVTMRIKDLNDISLQGDLQADNFSTSTDNKDFFSRQIILEDAQLGIFNQENITLNTKLSLDDMSLKLGDAFAVTASIKTDHLFFDLTDGLMKASSTLNTSNGKIVLDHQKTITANPQLELTVQMPLNAPDQLNYNGSITLSDASLRGFAGIPSLDNVELDADFQNDAMTINALSTNLLDTNIHLTGTVKNFKKPFLNINAEADELNLTKIKDLAPKFVAQYGLNFEGTSNVKVKFEGLLSDPLAAQILAVASVKNASAASQKLKQQITHITGIVEATPDSLKWRDFTAVYQGQKFSLAGNLTDFKQPKITATLNGPHLELDADLEKDHDLITLNDLKGKYMNAAFDSKGTVYLSPKNGPRFELNSNVSFLLENFINALADNQKKMILPLNPSGMISISANLNGTGLDWKNYKLKASITSPKITCMGYSLHDINTAIEQGDGKIKNLTFDGKFYDGTVHAVGSLDFLASGMPYDLAFNIDNTDMHQLKMDSPFKMDEINGKFFLTTLAHGTIADFKNNLHASGSLAIRDGFLAEFNLFKGLLSVLNDAMRLGEVEFTDVESNFTIDNQKISTDNLRLKGPTIVLLGKGWVDFDQMCDLHMTVDLSSGVVPAVAHDVLNSLNIHIYDKITNPKFKKKISVPQVINTLLKNLLQ